MHVAALQQFLRSLISPLEASEAKVAVIRDLEAACEGLEPFKSQTIREFSEFLRRAEEFDRTGVLSTPAPAKRQTRGSKPKTPKPPKMTVEEALTFVKDLYERSTSEDMSHALIQEEINRLNALTKPDLDKVIQGFGLGKATTKPKTLEAIRQKISDRRNSHQRTLSIY